MIAKAECVNSESHFAAGNSYHESTKKPGSYKARKPEGFEAKGNSSIRGFQASKHSGFRAYFFVIKILILTTHHANRSH